MSLLAVSVPRGKFSKLRAALLCTHDTYITHKIASRYRSALRSALKQTLFCSLKPRPKEPGHGCGRLTTSDSFSGGSSLITLMAYRGACIINSRCLARDAWHEMHDSRCLARDARHEMHDSKCIGDIYTLRGHRPQKANMQASTRYEAIGLLIMCILCILCLQLIEGRHAMSRRPSLRTQMHNNRCQARDAWSEMH